MIEPVKIVPLAAESFGVRSMCTYIQTPDVKLLVDPGVSLGPRFGLLPHPREYSSLIECREKIATFAKEAEIIVISHYHYDHCTPTYTDYVWTFSDHDVARQIYEGKIVIAKDIRSDINASQRRRGWFLQKTLKGCVKDFIVADNHTLVSGDTLLRFSSPVPHGRADSYLGYVIMLTIECRGIRVVYASDVQGPISDETLEKIIVQLPTLVYLGGPPLYLEDFKVSGCVLKHGLENAGKLVEKVPVVIFDHHLLRAEGWRKASNMVFEVARRTGHNLVTAAEFIDEENRLLEPYRKTLYLDEPPLDAFKRWITLPYKKRRWKKPPLAQR